MSFRSDSHLNSPHTSFKLTRNPAPMQQPLKKQNPKTSCERCLELCKQYYVKATPIIKRATPMYGVEHVTNERPMSAKSGITKPSSAR